MFTSEFTLNWFQSQYVNGWYGIINYYKYSIRESSALNSQIPVSLTTAQRKIKTNPSDHYVNLTVTFVKST